jgi:hypothetical protein
VFAAMNLLKSSPFFPALLGQKQATQPDLGNLMVVYEYTVHQGRTRWTHWSQIISEDILILFLWYFVTKIVLTY